MKFPSVTVIITVKNSKSTIKGCVESILKLNYPNYKIFITDAFSTDGTFEILKQLQERYPSRIRLEKVKGNIAAGHNYMIKRTKTQFVALTDADCIVDKNWLKNLILGFTSYDIVATAGFCSTSKNTNKLQRIIGMELEQRFRCFPDFISRAPTMNLCVRTPLAKKIKFDEGLDVAQETEWGYRLTQIGKMRYIPTAIVWHHHRATWIGFFKQQFRYGKFVPQIYLKKNLRRITGDHISTPSIFSQLLLFVLFCISLISSFIISYFIFPVIAFIFLLFILYSYDILRLTRRMDEIPLLFLLFFIRDVAWTVGVVVGILNLIKGHFK